MILKPWQTSTTVVVGSALPVDTRGVVVLAQASLADACSRSIVAVYKQALVGAPSWS